MLMNVILLQDFL